MTAELVAVNVAYVAIAFSAFVSGLPKIRVALIVGGAAFVWFGVLIDNLSMIIWNALLVLLNVWRLVHEGRAAERPKVKALVCAVSVDGSRSADECLSAAGMSADRVDLALLELHDELPPLPALSARARPNATASICVDPDRPESLEHRAIRIKNEIRRLEIANGNFDLVFVSHDAQDPMAAPLASEIAGYFGTRLITAGRLAVDPEAALGSSGTGRAVVATTEVLAPPMPAWTPAPDSVGAVATREYLLNAVWYDRQGHLQVGGESPVVRLTQVGTPGPRHGPPPVVVWRGLMLESGRTPGAFDDPAQPLRAMAEAIAQVSDRVVYVVDPLRLDLPDLGGGLRREATAVGEFIRRLHGRVSVDLVAHSLGGYEVEYLSRSGRLGGLEVNNKVWVAPFDKESMVLFLLTAKLRKSDRRQPMLANLPEKRIITTLPGALWAMREKLDWHPDQGLQLNLATDAAVSAAGMATYFPDCANQLGQPQPVEYLADFETALAAFDQIVVAGADEIVVAGGLAPHISSPEDVIELPAHAERVLDTYLHRVVDAATGRVETIPAADHNFKRGRSGLAETLAGAFGPAESIEPATLTSPPATPDGHRTRRSLVDLSSFGAAIYRRRSWVLLAWLAVAVAGIFAFPQVDGRVSGEFKGGDRLESTQVHDRLQELGLDGPGLVVVLDGVDLGDPATPRQVMRQLDETATVPGVASVVDPWRSGTDGLVATDRQAIGLVVALDPGLAEADRASAIHAVNEIADRLVEQGVAEDAVVGGESVVIHEFEVQAERDLIRGEMIAVPIALVAMVFIFGGVRAAGMPIAVAAGSFFGSMLVLLGATYLQESVTVFAINVVSMLGLGLGIDYGLLIVSRFREERGRGATVQQGVCTATATAGTTVVFSALTVAVSMSGLFVFEVPGLTSFGIAGLSAVLLSMLAALTLLPALLAIAGHRIKPSRRVAADRGGFYRMTKLVQRTPFVVATVVASGLVLAATPFLGVELQNRDAYSLPQSSQAREAAIHMLERFPERGAEPITVIAEADPGQPMVRAWVDEIADQDDVASVSVRSGSPDGTTIVDVIPTGRTQGAAALSLVQQLRDQDPGFETSVGGFAAETIDDRAVLSDRTPVAVAVVIVATLLILFLMTGSVFIPIKAVIMNLLSLGASFGALVWVFQDGNLSGLLGFEPTGSVDLFIPIFVFLFAFGLSMDYEVFLLSRIKEVYDQNHDDDESVAVGLQKSGRIITSAALLIVVVFAGFAAGEVLTIKQLGIGMAVAVIVDATVVRSLLVPATMKLAGRWNWWAPPTLRRVYERFGLSEAPQVPPLTRAIETPIGEAGDPAAEADRDQDCGDGPPGGSGATRRPQNEARPRGERPRATPATQAIG